MKLFRELIIILSIYLIGEFVSYIFHLPVPGNIIGMILLLVLLMTKKIKVSAIETVSNFFLDHLAFFFIPAGVGLISSFGILKSAWAKLLIVCILTTMIVIAITGLVVQFLVERKKS
ncbi:CidA/LrgA family protein [Clostridium fallax]|uniref:Holin-like protein n=1 Tax=Clostridium fallax TaxID=1533 RepID=A0A1M4WVQ3_9CLOT|nr:CidA/LrgA family protein [Clostridium fallax]SHE85237.1 holin-like protein [Clostridium fallax]SQB07429.1 LrgA family protein [Clostridium fallax]